MSLPQPNDTSHKQVTTSNHNSLRFLVRLFVHSSFHSPHHISCMTSFVFFFFFFFCVCSLCVFLTSLQKCEDRGVSTQHSIEGISLKRDSLVVSRYEPTIFFVCSFFFHLNYIFYYLFIYLFICLFHFYFYFICTLLSPSSYLQQN